MSFLATGAAQASDDKALNDALKTQMDVLRHYTSQMKVGEICVDWAPNYAPYKDAVKDWKKRNSSAQSAATAEMVNIIDKADIGGDKKLEILTRAFAMAEHYGETDATDALPDDARADKCPILMVLMSDPISDMDSTVSVKERFDFIDHHKLDMVPPQGTTRP